MQLLKWFLQDKRGNFATATGVLAVPLLICCGAAIDYTILHQTRSSLQEAADAAALASAKELGLASTKDENVKSVSKDYVLASLHESVGVGGDSKDVVVDTSISPARKDVTVDLAYYWKPLIIHYVNDRALPIKVTATASLAGDESICVIALDNSVYKAIDMGGKATINANGCAIYSNSKSQQSISVFKNSTMKASQIYAGGGYEGPTGSFKPVPVTDTPGITDPLIDRLPPTSSKIGADICDEDKYSQTSGYRKFSKDTVFCGGLHLSGSAELRLDPGVYIIKDGPLVLQGNSTLIGDNVGFYFTGSNATFEFGVSTQVSLTAPKSGPLSGILFFEDRNSPPFRQFTIRSKDAEKFEGTVYLPKGRLWIDKASKVGQQSRWTAIIANQIAIGNGPDIQINADYGASDIPVPNGIGPSGTPRLSR